MANILRESSMGGHTTQKNSETSKANHKTTDVKKHLSIPIKQLYLFIIFSILSLLFLVYCRTSPQEGQYSESNASSSKRNSLSSSHVQPSEPDEKIIPPKKEEHIFPNIGAIQNIQYQEDRLQGVFWRESNFDGNVYLTFDDGPNLSKDSSAPSLTVSESILNTLRDYHIQAAFFINGKNLEYRSDAEKIKLVEVLMRMINEGHIIGNHSYHHDNLAKGKYIDGIKDFEETSDEFLLTQKTLDELLGFHYPLILVRPPYAEPGRTENLDRWLIEKKYYLISLQFDSYDYAYSETGKWDSQGILDRIDSLLEESSSGGILLLHELESTSNLLPDLIQHDILDKGFKAETLDQLLIKKYGRQSEEK